MTTDPSQYFQELQEADLALSQAKLRTLVVEFQGTLARLPALKAEIDTMLAQGFGLDYEDFAARLEPILDQLTALLLEWDMLPSAIRDAAAVQEFLPVFTGTLTVRTAGLLMQKFNALLQDVERKIAEAKAQAKAEAERKIKAEQERAAQAKAEAEFKQKLASMFPMVKITGGTFKMGDRFGDGDSNEQPVHEVQVDSFYIGKYEVTQGERRAVMGSNPSHFQKGDNYPVERVSWEDVQRFLTRLNQLTGKQYRLPTEAEWEYAASSGGKDKWAGTSTEQELEYYAWFNKNSGVTTYPVGTKRPNSFGLYDMSGNVWEWCSDWYDAKYYSNSVRTNPPGASSGSDRVSRGGSWYGSPGFLRSAFRYDGSPGSAYGDLGFRLVLPVQ